MTQPAHPSASHPPSPGPAQDGHTYERAAIQKWFEKKGDVISPKTGLKLASKDVVPNHSLRALIQDHKASLASQVRIGKMAAHGPVRPLTSCVASLRHGHASLLSADSDSRCSGRDLSFFMPYLFALLQAGPHVGVTVRSLTLAAQARFGRTALCRHAVVNGPKGGSTHFALVRSAGRSHIRQGNQQAPAAATRGFC